MLPENVKKQAVELSHHSYVNRSGFLCGVTISSQGDLRTGARSRDQFVVSWMLACRGSYRQSPEGEAFSLDAPCVCMRRPDCGYTLKIEAAPSIRAYIELPRELYAALCVLSPELGEIPPVRPQPFCQELWDEFRALHAQLSAAPPERLYTLMGPLTHYILGVTGILDDRRSEPMLLSKMRLEDVRSRQTLAEIAAECGMNYHTFRKKFTEVWGMPPSRYRVKCRMEAACHALAAGESVSAIAEQLGFADVYTFIHRFTAEMGMPPGRWRGEMRK